MQLTETDVKNLRGLSEADARARLDRDGYNELPSAKKRGIFHIVLEVLREPMFLLLVACGTIYLFMPDGLEDALMLLGFVFVVMGITIYQESKTERAIDALRDLSSPRALVIRDGIQHRIPGREVATGDYIVLREGDRIPADAELVWGLNLSADESLLTGESVPVRKVSLPGDFDAAAVKPGGDDLPCLFSGSMVVQGQGVARVFATGMHTELGKIGRALLSIETEKTLLQKETARLVKAIFAIAIALCLAVLVVYGLTRGDWLQGVLSGITLAMAMLPEEFPVVLTIFLALGAWRMSRKQVLTRRAAAVETLGAATVLCSDKTGTLTQNRMTIRQLCAGGAFHDVRGNGPDAIPEEFHELVEFGILASKKDPFDPMERALVDLGHNALGGTEHLHEDWPLVLEYPLSRELLALSHVWRVRDGRELVVSAKGAPEAIADLCHLPPPERDAVLGQINVMAEKGLRVLGVARAAFPDQKLPANQHDFPFEFVGLIGWEDPVRPAVPAAIRECRTAGVRVVMITGDYPATARHIAREIGLENVDHVLTGAELESLDPATLSDRIRTTNIFARVVPEQKLLIVQALKNNGEIVAMTGDGVNDAPALKAAHIGVAMGERGTDVARESSELVLLDDDFSSIVSAVRLGRRIYDNLKKAMAYIISVHIPIAGLSLLPVIFDWPLVLMPVHIVFLELIIDPACSVVFENEPEERDVMNRPPRDPKEPLFGRRMLLLSLLQGFFSLGLVTAVYLIALDHGQSEAEARTITFMTMIISNLCLIMTNRSWASSILHSFRVMNKALLWVVGGALAFLALVIYVEPLQAMFKFSQLHPQDLLIAVTVGAISVFWFEMLKLFARKRGIVLLRK